MFDADGKAFGHVDVDSAEGVDELREALHVDEHVVLQFDPQRSFDGIPRRFDARVASRGDGVGVELGMLFARRCRGS